MLVTSNEDQLRHRNGRVYEESKNCVMTGQTQRHPVLDWIKPILRLIMFSDLTCNFLLDHEWLSLDCCKFWLLAVSCYTFNTTLSAVPGPVWFCVKIHRVYRMCIKNPKAEIFHSGLLSKDNSTWLSMLRLFWVLCMFLLRSNYMDFSNILQTAPVFLTWGSSLPQPCSSLISLLDIFYLHNSSLFSASFKTHII